MNNLETAVKTIENRLAGKSIDMDVFVKTGEDDGDGYAYVFKNSEGKFEVNLLQNRIPKRAWESEEGMEEAYEINEEGKVTCLFENNLQKAVETVINYWRTPLSNVKVLSFEVKEDELIRFVIEL